MTENTGEHSENNTSHISNTIQQQQQQVLLYLCTYSSASVRNIAIFLLRILKKIYKIVTDLPNINLIINHGLIHNVS